MAAQTTAGSASTGTVTYENGLDTFATDTAVTLTVSEIDEVMVKGSYTATVGSTNNGDKTLSGSFSMCRVADFLPP